MTASINSSGQVDPINKEEFSRQFTILSGENDNADLVMQQHEKATYYDENKTGDKFLILDNENSRTEDSLYAGNSTINQEEDTEYHNFVEMRTQESEIAEGFLNNDSKLLKGEQVFLNNLRLAKRNGALSRDQVRQLREDARRLEWIKSDRFRNTDSHADLIPDAQWEKQQLKFAHTKKQVLGIVQSALHVEASGREAKEHMFRQSTTNFTDTDQYSAVSVRAEYRKLNRHIHRFTCKIQKNGAFMRMTKVPFESKWRKIIAEARDYIQEVHAFRERQRALGLLIEDDEDDAKDGKPKQSFVSAETEHALLNAKKKLSEVLHKTQAAGQLNEVWLRMMVDYWESKRLMEQTYGEHQQLVNGGDEINIKESELNEDGIELPENPEIVIADEQNKIESSGDGILIKVDSMVSSENEADINTQPQRRVTKSDLLGRIKQLKEKEKAMKDTIGVDGEVLTGTANSSVVLNSQLQTLQTDG